MQLCWLVTDERWCNLLSAFTTLEDAMSYAKGFLTEICSDEQTRQLCIAELEEKALSLQIPTNYKECRTANFGIDNFVSIEALPLNEKIAPNG